MFEIKMPQAGQTMEDGTVVRWHKAEGEAVKEGELLLEVETDKATVEVESTHSGTLRKVLCAEGVTVPVHATIALVGSPEEPLPAAPSGESPQLTKERSAARQGEPPVEETPKWVPATAATSPGASHVEPPAAAPTAIGGEAAPASAALPPPPAGVIPILMPKPGQSVEEGEIVAWHVKPGDRVKSGDILFDVETDKATIEVEATDAGRVSRIVLKEGETSAVLQPVAYLSEDDAAVDAYLARVKVAPIPSGAQTTAGTADEAAAISPGAKTQAIPGLSQAAVGTPAATYASAPQVRAVAPGERIYASPAARKIASERGVDLAAIPSGRGPGGRILSTDVLSQAGGTPTLGAAPVPAGPPVVRKMSPMRRAIAKNLLASKQNIPHFYMRMTLDAGPMMAFYRAEKAKYPCSVNDVVSLACARVIAEFPAFRSRLDKNEVVEFAHANIGIAVGMDDGLVVPVLAGAETMSLRQLAAETRRLAEAARGGRIEGLGLGVFTITNLGMFGVEEFAAIINPPEGSILAVGAVREDVVVSGGAIRPGLVMTVTLSADHRLIDGLMAAKFLARLKEVLQAPAQLG